MCMIQDPSERTFITALDSAFHAHSLAVTGLLQSLCCAEGNFGYLFLLSMRVGSAAICCTAQKPKRAPLPDDRGLFIRKVEVSGTAREGCMMLQKKGLITSCTAGNIRQAVLPMWDAAGEDSS